MLERTDHGGDAPRTLEDLLHSLNNSLAAIRSGCLVIEDALGTGDVEEIRTCVAEMRDRLDKASRLVRAVPVFVTATPDE